MSYYFSLSCSSEIHKNLGGLLHEMKPCYLYRHCTILFIIFLLDFLIDYGLERKMIFAFGFYHNLALKCNSVNIPFAAHVAYLEVAK